MNAAAYSKYFEKIFKNTAHRERKCRVIAHRDGSYSLVQGKLLVMWVGPETAKVAFSICRTKRST